MFKSDNPITKSEEDLLGRSGFANALAEAILSYKDTESVVTGLYGKWGSGKSSVINMCVEHIESTVEELPKNQRPIVIRFNPWNYSDQNQLITQFFKQLSLALKWSDLSDDAIGAADQLEAYAAFFEPMALIPDPSIGSFALLMTRIMNKFGAASRRWGNLKKKDLEGTRKDLNKVLFKQEQKLLIIIDDIDRLNSNEIRKIFQLVKMLGDFPNTIYLLSFDSEIVVDSLKDVQKGVGEEYLEKIVQIPFELPVADQEAVNQYLFSLIDQLLHDLPSENWDSVYWGNVLHSGLKGFFTNLRDVTRFINILSFGFQAVKSEVNVIDFIALTALQVFDPEVYRGIRDNKDVFTGLISSGYGSDESEKTQLKARCDEVLSRSKTGTVIDLNRYLTIIFPKLESVYGNHGYSSDFLSEWRREGRVCSPDKFDTFFRLSIPKSEISENELRAILSVTSDEESFTRALLSLCEDDRINRFLERFEDYTSEMIQDDDVQATVNVLMNIGDSFPNGEGSIYFSGAAMQVSRICHRLTKNIESQDNRFEIYKVAIEKSEDSIYPLLYKIGVFSQENGRHNTEGNLKSELDRTVNIEQLKILESIALDKIRIFSSSGKLIKHRDLLSIIYRWHDFSGSYSEPKEFVREAVKTASGLIDIICSVSSKVYSHSVNDYVSKETLKIDLKSLGSFMDHDELVPQVRYLLGGDILTQEEETYLQLYVDTYDGKIEEF